MTSSPAASLRTRITAASLLGLLVLFIALSVERTEILRVQPAGVDFAGLWAGGKAAITDVRRLYDFQYVSELQGWPLGPRLLRPYVYPPSALWVFVPFALVPWPVGYVAWTVLTALAFFWAGIKAGAPRWFVLIPWVIFAAICGQATFLLGALVMTGLRLSNTRPIVAGVLFGVAAAIKPQILMLLPLALVAEGHWRAIIATGVTGLGLCAASAAVWGIKPWLEWSQAVPQFEHLVSHARLLVVNMITPYSALVMIGQRGTWALLLTPLAAYWVWRTFRAESTLADRTIVLFGGAFLISPYAMNYELALFAPATAAYLARTKDRRWPAYVIAAVGQAAIIHPAFANLAATLALPVSRIVLGPLLGESDAAPEPSSNPNS